LTKRPIVVAVISDTHCGSTVGLFPTSYVLDDANTVGPSPGQKWMWRQWKLYCAKVQVAAEQHNAKVITIVNGDVTEGLHHKNYQVHSLNSNDHVRIAYKALEPLIMLSEQVYVVRGTPSHTGGAGKLEEQFTADLTNAVKDGNRYTWDHLYLDVNGVKFDIAHHGRLGRLPHTRPNALNGIAVATIANYAMTGHKFPNLVIRSHLHQFADTGLNYPTRVIATPAWQLITAYVHKIQPGELADIGGLIFVCHPGGKYDLDVVRFRPARRRPVKVMV
jgi:hypothetical protein